MKLSILTTLLWLAAAGPVNASSIESSFKLLNHAQFTALDRADRADYLESLRAAALQSEKEAPVETSRNTAPSAFFVSLVLNQAYAAQGDMCIFAGYVSERDSRNRCIQPSSSSGSCGSGQTMCNPLLYGYGPNSGGICTSSRSTPTSDCEKQYQAIPNYKAYQVADQLVGKNQRAQFDAQAEKLSTYCASAAAQGQKSICQSLKSKTAYMKAKIVASEKRKKDKATEQAKANAADADKDKIVKKEETAPVAKAAEVTPAAAPSTGGSSGADGKASAGAKAPSVASTASPAGTASAPGASAPSQAPPETKPEPKPEVKAAAEKPAVKKAVAPACIKNKDDLEKQRDNLAEDLQDLDDKRPLFYAGTQTINKPFVGDINITSTMKISVTSLGRFKLTSNVLLKPAVMNAWQAEDDIQSICPTGKAGLYDVTMANGAHLEVNVGSSKMNVKSSKGSMPYGKVSESTYNNRRAALTSTGVKVWKNDAETAQVAK